MTFHRIVPTVFLALTMLLQAVSASAQSPISNIARNATDKDKGPRTVKLSDRTSAVIQPTYPRRALKYACIVSTDRKSIKRTLTKLYKKYKMDVSFYDDLGLSDQSSSQDVDEVFKQNGIEGLILVEVFSKKEYWESRTTYHRFHQNLFGVTGTSTTPVVGIKGITVVATFFSNDTGERPFTTANSVAWSNIRGVSMLVWTNMNSILYLLSKKEKVLIRKK